MTVYCTYCQKAIPDETIKARHYSENTMPERMYCNREHRTLYEQQTGVLKEMSVAGKEKRIEAVKHSNRTHPRRKRKQKDTPIFA